MNLANSVRHGPRVMLRVRPGIRLASLAKKEIDLVHELSDERRPFACVVNSRNQELDSKLMPNRRPHTRNREIVLVIAENEMRSVTIDWFLGPAPHTVILRLASRVARTTERRGAVDKAASWPPLTLAASSGALGVGNRGA